MCKNRRLLLDAALVLFVTVLAMAPSLTLAAVPDSIYYSGILKSSGVPVPDDSYGVTFRIYSSPSGGSPLWTEYKIVTTNSGLFSTLLGSDSPIHASIFSAPNRFLGIQVNPDPEMVPRIPIVTAPYAYRIATIDGATGGAIAGDASISGDVTITGGNLDLDASTATAGNILKDGVRFIYNKGKANTFVGLLSGNTTMSGTFNTILGDSAFTVNTTGYGNTALGAWSLASNMTGYRNIAIGREALFENTTATDNVAIGASALHEVTNRGQNVAIGSSALYNNTGGGNTAVGEQALQNSTGGELNTAVGEQALLNNVTGTRNTGIGNGADVGAEGLYNCTAIGNDAVVNVSNTMVFGDAGVVRRGFGVNAAAGHAIEIGTTVGNGNGAYLTSGGNWTNTSDRNCKEGITAVDERALLEKVSRLPIYQWNYKNEDPTHKHVGPMAQDFHAAFGLGDDDKHISTVDPAGVALAAIQALYEQAKSDNERLRAEIAELRKLIGEHSGAGR